MALAEALRLLETPGNPARDVIILTDGQRSSWRPEEPARWSLPREIHRDISRRSGVTPRVWVINFGGTSGPPRPTNRSGHSRFRPDWSRPSGRSRSRRPSGTPVLRS